MDDPDKIILDISSDEEVGWGEGGLTSAGDGEAGVRDDGDWIAELLVEVGRKSDDSDKVVDDSDEVVVVDEILPSKKRKVEKPSAERVESVEHHDEDDDDCVVLDGDPDKPVEVNNDAASDDSDDLLLVSEKGQVACRDYPHPRHLCVKFPFSSTPHEMHCHQCHCYVCDSLAPCIDWGGGTSSIDHCHATEKEEYWKSQRKNSKNRGVALPVVPAAANTSVCLESTAISLITSLCNNGLKQSQPNFKQSGGTLTATDTNTTSSNVSNHARMHLSRCNTGGKYPHHLVSQQLQRVGSVDPQSISRCMPSNGPQTASCVMPVARHGYNASRNNNRIRISMKQHPRPRIPVTPALGMHQTPFQHYAGVIPPNLSTQPSMESGVGCYPSPPTQLFSQPYPNANLVVPLPHSQWPAQNYVPNMFGSSIPLPHETASLSYSNAGFGFTPFQSQGASQMQVPYPAHGASQMSVPYQDQLPSFGSTHDTSNAVTAQPAAPAQPSFRSLLEDGAEVHEPPHVVSNEGTQAEIELGSSSADGGGSWHGPAQESNKNVPESTQLQSLFLQDNPTADSDPQSLALLDLEFDDWMLPNGSAFDLETLNIPVPTQLDVQPPDSFSINKY